MLAILGGWTLLVVIGLWLYLMTSKKGWKITQLIGGMLLMCALYGNFPTLPGQVNTSLNSIINTFTK